MGNAFIFTAADMAEKETRIRDLESVAYAALERARLAEAEVTHWTKAAGELRQERDRLREALSAVLEHADSYGLAGPDIDEARALADAREES